MNARAASGTEPSDMRAPSKVVVSCSGAETGPGQIGHRGAVAHDDADAPIGEPHPALRIDDTLPVEWSMAGSEMITASCTSLALIFCMTTAGEPIKMVANRSIFVHVGPIARSPDRLGREALA